MRSSDIKVGDTVIYTPPHLKGAQSDRESEVGVVTSKNNWHVFIRFGAEKHSKACHFQNVRLQHAVK